MIRRQNHARARLRVALVTAVCALAFPTLVSDAAARPLETAVTDGGPFISEPELAFQIVQEAGAGSVRIYVSWAGIAPVADSNGDKPAGFDARDPADPAYNWALLDRQVNAAAAAGVAPILAVSVAPSWAERPDADFRPGTWRPKPQEFGDFMFAVATRYGGNFGGLPRVVRYQAWNEPNLFSHLLPQYNISITKPVTVDSRPVSPDIYRPLVNALATSVHRVHRDNVVIAGGLAPFGRYAAYDHGVAPLAFMRQLLCLNKRNKPQPRCKEKVSFDVWSTHPYTQGGPTIGAKLPDNVSLADLPRMRKVLRAGERTGHIRSRRAVKFWITEISWDTDPPDPGGVPLKLHARWVSEMLYRTWRDGISLVTWFQLKDEHDPEQPKSREFTSGLYFYCDDGALTCAKPKPALRAFRFPFVAFRKKNKVRFWGRTPGSQRGKVTVEQRRTGGWRRVARMRTNRDGIFKGRYRTRNRKPLRATGLGDRSQPFSLKRAPDLRVNPFGGCERAEAEEPVCPSGAG